MLVNSRFKNYLGLSVMKQLKKNSYLCVLPSFTPPLTTHVEGVNKKAIISMWIPSGFCTICNLRNFTPHTLKPCFPKNLCNVLI